MAIYALANQKGGVGKTTTAVNLAACVADAGHDTLLVDLDPQCNATVGLGVAKDREPSVYDSLGGDVSVGEAAMETDIPRLWLVPSTPDLAGANAELPRLPGSETRLRDVLGDVRERFLFTVLDCPPSLGPLTVNALVAADRVMILTMHDGRTRLAQDVEREVREHFPELVFDTIVPRNVRIGEAPSFGVPVTRHDPSCSGSIAYLKLAKEVAARG